jgi:hypothetical protein
MCRLRRAAGCGSQLGKSLRNPILSSASIGLRFWFPGGKQNTEKLGVKLGQVGNVNRTGSGCRGHGFGERFMKDAGGNPHLPQKFSVTDLLEQDPHAPGVVILQRLRAAGYAGGSTILYSYLGRVRPSRSAPRAFADRKAESPGKQTPPGVVFGSESF